MDRKNLLPCKAELSSSFAHTKLIPLKGGLNGVPLRYKKKLMLEYLSVRFVPKDNCLTNLIEAKIVPPGR
jgi:hypothetical protein